MIQCILIAQPIIMENQSLDPVASRSVEKFLSIFLDFSSFIGLVMTVVTLLNSASTLSHILFLTSIGVLHTVGTIRIACPKYELEAGLGKRLLLCPDLHYLTILAIITINRSCPFLYVILYGFFFAARAAICAVDRLKIGSEYARDWVRKLVTGSIFASIPSYIEIGLCLELLWNALVEFTLFAWFTLFVYIGWLILFNFASSEIHVRVWARVSLFMREIAAKHADTVGPLIERIVDQIGAFGAAAAKMYPGKELKVHLK
jgi:hypothetical protein